MRESGKGGRTRIIKYENKCIISQPGGGAY